MRARDHSRKIRPTSERVLGVLVAGALAAFVLAACSSTSTAPSSGGGKTATFALQPTDSFTWMLPLENGANEEPWTLGIDENLWLPLYFEGKGSAPVINYALSLALPPTTRTAAGP